MAPEFLCRADAVLDDGVVDVLTMHAVPPRTPAELTDAGWTVAQPALERTEPASPLNAARMKINKSIEDVSFSVMGRTHDLLLRFMPQPVPSITTDGSLAGSIEYSGLVRTCC